MYLWSDSDIKKRIEWVFFSQQTAENIQNTLSSFPHQLRPNDLTCESISPSKQLHKTCFHCQDKELKFETQAAHLGTLKNKYQVLLE